MSIIKSMIYCKLVHVFTVTYRYSFMHHRVGFDQLRICMEAVIDMKVLINKWNRHIAEETSLTAKFFVFMCGGEPIRTSHDSELAEKQLRNAIHLQKNGIKKAKSLNKNKNKAENDVNIGV
ncbi:PREDICTED: uncharacterized protein LOC108974739 [Bactrocera latifrons]|uniref:uncharacterized protein LOC108974739 n=1 Tax=Bactrocera latifrons TaxID=174628 RepID=UPI0008DC8A53|nr:PREDICTED: uncharacterized protein LOC108974739 [Bactrocera latifrons]XP_018798310.1 PREDICTED: uncharacterized protein LOC108974739 [Bactrocera latifrons]XP_018798311.1 PREDICTED: uncharacterized protein LOC108974739 [Bactrocera latifrons]